MLSHDCIRKCAVRARRYILAYHTLQQNEDVVIQGNDRVKEEGKPELLGMALVERLIKVYKTHRCAADFDKSFVQDLLQKMQKIGKIES